MGEIYDSRLADMRWRRYELGELSDAILEDLYQAFKYRLMQELAAEKPGKIVADDGYGRQLYANPELFNLVDKDQS